MNIARGSTCFGAGLEVGLRSTFGMTGVGNGVDVESAEVGSCVIDDMLPR